MRRFLPVLAVLLLAPVTVADAAGSATQSPRSDTTVQAAPQPVIARDFPDADILRTSTRYYAYSTNSTYSGKLLNIPVAYSTDPTGAWTLPGVDALPKLPSWVVYDEPSRTYLVWAPDVSRRDDGKYLMYYSAKHTSGILCIGAAISSTPMGPFTPVGVEPLVCNPGDHGDIDPSSLVVDGRRFLVYKDNANSAGQPASVWIHETASNGINWIGERHKLLTADTGGDEKTVLDAPTIVRRDGRYLLLYSADAWNATYHVKYAESEVLTAPYTKRGTLIDNATWPGQISNPGGQDVVTTADGTEYLAFHAWVNGGRGLHLAPLSWCACAPRIGR